MDRITVEVQIENDCDTLKKTGTVEEVAAWIAGLGFTKDVSARNASHLLSSESAMARLSSPVVLRKTERGAREVHYTFFRRPYEVPKKHTLGIL